MPQAVAVDGDGLYQGEDRQAGLQAQFLAGAARHPGPERRFGDGQAQVNLRTAVVGDLLDPRGQDVLEGGALGPGQGEGHVAGGCAA